MPKGYWIVRVNVRELERYKKYTEVNVVAIGKYGGRFLVRGGKAEAVMGEGCERSVVIEFPDYETARACFDSPEYQHALEVRGDAAEANIIIVEGFEGPQPG